MSNVRQSVGRNVLHLLVAQIATGALSFAATILLARQLGAQDYGTLIFAGAFVQFWFLLVDLGQDPCIIRAVARQREISGELLGTSLALRVAAAAAISLPLLAAAWLLGYPERTRMAIALMVAFRLAASLSGAVSSVFRGLERMDRDAVSQVSQEALVTASIALVAWAGGGLAAIIAAQIVAAAAALTVYLSMLRGLGTGPLRVVLRTVGLLFARGSPFLFWSVLVTLSANVDTILLSKLAPPEVVGWLGVSLKLIGVLIFPATILATSIYPTLSRLFAEQAHRDLLRSSLRPILILGVPAAVGTYLFADQAIALLYGGKFAPAAAILRALSPLLFLLYVNVTLGTALKAFDRLTLFAWAKVANVLLDVVLSLLLIPYCQSRFGNGGLGVAVAMTIAELVMLGAALALLPRATLAPELWRDLARALAAGAGMVGAVRLLGTLAIGLAIPAALIAYLAGAVAVGAIGRRDLALLRDLARAGARSPSAGGS